MPETRRIALDEILAPSSYSFLVVELAFKDERDLPGLLRYKLESALPRGLEGLRSYFRRIGRSGRLLATLVKEPVPEGFAPSRISLPFALRLPERDAARAAAREILWVSRNAAFKVRYEEGLLASIEVVAPDLASQGTATDGRPPLERREASGSGPSIQQAVGGGGLLWKLSAAALGLALAAQLALAAAQAISSREARLAALNERIAMLSKLAAAGATTAPTAATNTKPVAVSDTAYRLAASDTGLQTRADEIQKSVSRGWKAGYYLEKWSLGAGRLRLEGWGPSALALLESLRSDPALARLELASGRREEGYEVFVFEGEAGDD